MWERLHCSHASCSPTAFVLIAVPSLFIRQDLAVELGGVCMTIQVRGMCPLQCCYVRHTILSLKTSTHRNELPVMFPTLRWLASWHSNNPWRCMLSTKVTLPFSSVPSWGSLCRVVALWDQITPLKHLKNSKSDDSNKGVCNRIAPYPGRPRTLLRTAWVRN